MECQHASELIISAADGELVDATLLTEARLHCITCPECRAIERLLEREHALSVPVAPESLVSRLDAIARDEARRVARPVVTEAPSMVPPISPQRQWSRFVALAGAAAVLLIGLSVGALINGPAGEQVAADNETAMQDERASESAAPPDEDARAFSTAEESAIPAYVVFDGVVYARSDEPSPSGLTTVGTIVSDLGTGTSGDHPAMSEPGTVDPLYVQGPDGAYMSFGAVVRSLDEEEYALTSDQPITHFGQWPTLPSAYAVPESSDGSPVFVKRGFDDHGQAFFGPPDIGDAFAIAPGTPVDDPAAGNPNWTWWVKVQ